MRFESPEYKLLNKNSRVEPVLVLSIEAAFPISVRIFETDGTATGMSSGRMVTSYEEVVGF